MEMSKLAEALGLKPDAPQGEIFGAAAKLIKDRSKDVDDLKAALATAGLKLDAGKVVKSDGTALDAAPKPPPADETPREKAMREELEATQLTTAKLQLDNVKAEVERAIKGGKLPPALAADVTKLLSAAGRTQALSLSSDGSKLVKDAFDVAATVRKVIDALPSITKEGLAALAGAGQDSDEEKKKKEADALEIKKIAAKADPSLATK